MRLSPKLVLVIALLCPTLWGQTCAHFQWSCMTGNAKVTTSGMPSSTLVQASYPQCSVTVYNTGTQTPSALYADNACSQVKGNPFTANTNGAFDFYVIVANTPAVDVVMSGGLPAPGFPSPVTISDVIFPVGSGASIPAIYALDGATVGQQPTLNFSNAGSITFGVVNNPGANRVDVTATNNGVTSLVMENSGVPWSTPASGGVTFNFIGCTVGGASPSFTVSCAPGSLSGSGLLANALPKSSAIPTTLVPSSLRDNATTVTTPEPLVLTATSNQIVTGASPNQITLNFGVPSGAVTLTFPVTADTLVGRATTDTLTNKSIAAIEINSGQIGAAYGGTGANSSASNGVAQVAAGVWTFISPAGTKCYPFQGIGGTGCDTPAGTGVTGTGTSTYMPYWSGASSLGSTADMTYTSGSHTFAGGASGIFDFHSASSFEPPGGGGTLILGTANINWATLGTGIVVNTTTTGAKSVYNASSTIPNSYLPPTVYGYTFPGVPTASAYVTVGAPAAATFPANFTGTGLISAVSCGTNPTSTTTFTLYDGASAIGTVALNSSCAGTFATTGGTTQPVSANDRIKMVAPGSPDATAADIVFTMRATRN